MRYFKIYDEKYPLETSSSVPADGYGYKNAIQDFEPKGKILGYATMEDGSIIECHKHTSILLILLPVLLLLGGGGFAGYYYLQNVEFDTNISNSDFVVSNGEGTDVVTYTGFMGIHDNELTVNFTNGAEEATISVVGEGITAADYVVQPYETVASIPVTFTTKDSVVNATLKITTASSSTENAVVVEIFQNNLPDAGTDSLEGYWEGEVIYGIQPIE